MSHLDIQEMSLINLAEQVLHEIKEPLDLYQLFDKVLEMSRHNHQEEISEVLNAFYTDLTSSAKFIYMGNNTWDLKRHQKNDLWDKDGSFYNEYAEVHDAELDVRIAEAQAAEEAHLAKIEARRLAEEAKAEAEAAQDEAEAIEATDVIETEEAPIEVIVPEPEPKPVEEEVVSTEADDTVKDDEKAETIEPLEEDDDYDDFDEEEYNEYMDSYEDEYDK